MAAGNITALDSQAAKIMGRFYGVEAIARNDLAQIWIKDPHVVLNPDGWQRLTSAAANTAYPT